MSAAERLREKAGYYELQAEHAREFVPEDAIAPEALTYAVQNAVFAGIAVALHEIANVLEEAA